MKTIVIELRTEEGQVVQSLEVEDYGLARPSADSEAMDTFSLLARIEGFLGSIANLLDSEGVVPVNGMAGLRLAVGRVLLSAEDDDDDQDEEVRIVIAVQRKELVA